MYPGQRPEIISLCHDSTLIMACTLKVICWCSLIRCKRWKTLLVTIWEKIIICLPCMNKAFWGQRYMQCTCMSVKTSFNYFSILILLSSSNSATIWNLKERQWYVTYKELSFSFMLSFNCLIDWLLFIYFSVLLLQIHRISTRLVFYLFPVLFYAS